MTELIKFYMLYEGMGKDWENAYFDFITDKNVSWKYRGQVTPKNKQIITVMDVVEQQITDDECYVLADTSLWVDDLRIYETSNLGIKIRIAS